MNLSEKIFERDIDEVEVGISDIVLATKGEIESYQLGYQINGVTGEKIEDWFGEEFIVIGEDTALGDPIIAKVDEENVPIYWMIHDDWTSLTKIADSFKVFIQILHLIDDADLSNETQKENILKEILALADEKAMIYWESLIVNAYEFYNEEE